MSKKHCLSCDTDNTPLGHARRLQQHVENVVKDLDTINGMAKSVVAKSPAIIASSELLNQRIFENLCEASAITNSLLDDSFHLTNKS